MLWLHWHRGVGKDEIVKSARHKIDNFSTFGCPIFSRENRIYSDFNHKHIFTY